MTDDERDLHDDEKKNKSDGSGSSSSSDESSSSGSSSSSDSSDSESEAEDEQNQQVGNGQGAPTTSSPLTSNERINERKYSMESAASSSGTVGPRDLRAPGEPVNVNSSRAATRFKAVEKSEMGLMALGTKKRDRRTIEEIQRDLQKRRQSSTNGSRNGSLKKSNGASGIGASHNSPPKGSPVLSPDSGTDTPPLSLPASQYKVKGKPNSARSRLAAIVMGRGKSTAKPKKPTTSSSSGVSMVTNISAGKIIKTGVGNSSTGTHHEAESKIEQTREPMKMEPKIEPKIIESKPDAKTMRSILRALLRFADLTDVDLISTNPDTYADEYRQASFVNRANLAANLKTPEERLQKFAVELMGQAEKAVENKHDSVKYADLEIKPSQVIERLYENLKLRVAIQRAMRRASVPVSSKVNGAYILVAKEIDLVSLGVPRDLPAWTWAEKEHDWSPKKDATLLVGIYLHGFGSWEDILNDDLLHFNQQRALKGERMKKRAETLLRKLPDPDGNGEPRIVRLANALAPQVPAPMGQSLGAQFSAILNNGKTNKAQRSAGRGAVRQATSGGQSSTGNHDDSIRKSNTQSNPSSTERVPSRTSPTTLANSLENEAEDGEVDTTSGIVEKAEKVGSKRSASPDQTPRKKVKRQSSAKRSSKSKSQPNQPQLSEAECIEKWKPAKRLKDIRQVLKKMKKISAWSNEQQNDSVVVEKVLKYITTIGDTIDRIVLDAGKEQASIHEWDELCSCLWSYAAGYTPFTSVVFERLYDDICADGAAPKSKESPNSNGSVHAARA